MTETGPPASRLTPDDRRLIVEARDLAPALKASGIIRDMLSGQLLTRLADLAERLDDAEGDSGE